VQTNVTYIKELLQTNLQQLFISKRGVSDLDRNLKQRKFDYKWVIVGLCFLMVFICLGFCSTNKGLYLSAITEALGIKRSAFSINDSCRYVTTAVINVFFGTLVSKFGTRKMIAAGFICLIASSLVYSVAESMFVFYIGGCLLGLGLSWTTTTMVGCVVNKWCKENKGTIMGAVLAANGVGGAIAAQIISPIIYQEGNPFGYRDSYRLVALILLITGAIVVGFFRETPKNQDAAPKTTDTNTKSRGQNWIGVDYKFASKKVYFYGASICIFLTGMVLQGITGIAAAHLKDVGLDPSYVASVMSVHLLALAACKFLTGLIYDRCGLRITMTICHVTSIGVMLLLSAVSSSGIGMVLAMLYGVFSALALPLETVMLPIFASDLFGEKSYNKIMGLFVSFNTAGFAVGTPLANWAFDTFGTYKPALIASCFIMIFVTLVFQFVLTDANKVKNKVIENN